MNLIEINSEIISLEFQFSDVTSQINPVTLSKQYASDKIRTARSIDNINRALEINEKLAKLLSDRADVLKNMLPE